MPEIITSETNERIKYLKKLYRKRQRKEQGKFILEGYRIVDEVLKAGSTLDAIYITPGFGETMEGKQLLQKIKPEMVVFVEERILNKLADTVNPQGIIAVASEPQFNLEKFFEGASLILVLDCLQDPGNMGTIIRTAVAAGADGIIALKGSVDIYNLKVLRATMGAIFSIPIITDVELEDFRLSLEKNAADFLLVSTDITADKYYTECQYDKPVIIVIGNEANGIREEIISMSDEVVKLPIVGQIDSLNAAVAAGIIIYKVLEFKNR